MSIVNIILIVVALLVIYIIGAYNGFIKLSNRAKEAISDIDVQSKRRYDLIPNLIATVKGYMTHERETLESVTKARTEVMQAGGDPLQKEKSENALAGTLKTLFAVSENYPDLKANANFLDLQRELADTENKIQASRRFYNAVAKDMNVKVESFPSNIIARLFKFTQEKYFAVEAQAEKEVVQVKF